jgi:hypothetical protein
VRFEIVLKREPQVQRRFDAVNQATALISIEMATELAVSHTGGDDAPFPSGRLDHPCPPDSCDD